MLAGRLDKRFLGSMESGLFGFGWKVSAMDKKAGMAQDGQNGWVDGECVCVCEKTTGDRWGRRWVGDGSPSLHGALFKAPGNPAEAQECPSVIAPLCVLPGLHSRAPSPPSPHVYS